MDPRLHPRAAHAQSFGQRPMMHAQASGMPGSVRGPVSLSPSQLSPPSSRCAAVGGGPRRGGVATSLVAKLPGRRSAPGSGVGTPGQVAVGTPGGGVRLAPPGAPGHGGHAGVSAAAAAALASTENLTRTATALQAAAVEVARSVSPLRQSRASVSAIGSCTGSCATTCPTTPLPIGGVVAEGEAPTSPPLSSVAPAQRALVLRQASRAATARDSSVIPEGLSSAGGVATAWAATTPVGMHTPVEQGIPIHNAQADAAGFAASSRPWALAAEGDGATRGVGFPPSASAPAPPGAEPFALIARRLGVNNERRSVSPLGGRPRPDSASAARPDETNGRQAEVRDGGPATANVQAPTRGQTGIHATPSAKEVVERLKAEQSATTVHRQLSIELPVGKDNGLPFKTGPSALQLHFQQQLEQLRQRMSANAGRDHERAVRGGGGACSSCAAPPTTSSESVPSPPVPTPPAPAILLPRPASGAETEEKAGTSPPVKEQHYQAPSEDSTCAANTPSHIGDPGSASTVGAWPVTTDTALQLTCEERSAVGDGIELSAAQAHAVPAHSPHNVFAPAPVPATSQSEARADMEEIARSAAGRMLVVAEGLQRQLDEVLKSLRVEQKERENLTSTVRTVEQRLNEGLASMSEVIAARANTDGSTEDLLNALRTCVDELNVQCAWPPASSHLNGENAPASTLAETVQLQAAQLGELKRLQELLCAQHDEQRQVVETTSAWMSQHRQELDDSLAAVTAVAASAPPRQESVMASVQVVQQRVGELAASIATMPPAEELLSTLYAQDVQLQALQADKAQAQEVFKAFSEQQQMLIARLEQQEEVLKSLVAARDNAEPPARPDNLATEDALQELRSEVAIVANGVSVLCARVDDLAVQSNQNSLQTELGAIASVVTSLGERVDLMSSQQAPAGDASAVASDASAAGTSTMVDVGSTEETAQALRMQLGRLIGEAQRVNDEKNNHFRGPSTMLQNAPSPRKWMSEPLSVSVGREQGGQFAGATLAPGVLATGGRTEHLLARPTNSAIS